MPSEGLATREERLGGRKARKATRSDLVIGRRHFLLRPAPPQRPLCSWDGLGVPDNVLGRVEPKRALGRTTGGVQTSDVT
jgi:hypothetical protein